MSETFFLNNIEVSIFLMYLLKGYIRYKLTKTCGSEVKLVKHLLGRVFRTYSVS